ncbi:ArsR/SmtB family transcription factor [Paeniglutamicibacter psychrophenolicus]|uniref:ArsR/SmtB family transcription factor n=1 Tax=Paeniglutamicibacter psychrophenolicus TaxID=257454 RepID=UPI0027858C06|nr:winged helix-turn-helix transcriptional regulator [Paeniglutamicibacter psychrophenolicus]MDQ0093813.1 DNA-binding transcriptional ArsR family regulator [Paeniglutamicibacter psychrophenolicus]
MPETEHSKIGADAVAASAPNMPDWIDVFALVADATRMKILIAMHAAPDSSVSQLASATALGANTVTQALATLHKAGVVSVRADGRYRRWTLTHPDVHRLLHQMQAPHSELHPEHPQH